MTELLTKITVPTVVLKDVVGRAIKCSTMEDGIPMTTLMQLQVSSGKLFVRTTNNIDFFTAFADVDSPDFDVIVNAKLFSQTVSKLTSETTSFVLENNILTIEANGKHNIRAEVEADGSKLNFPTLDIEPSGNTYHITQEEIKSILSLNKSCKGEKGCIPAIASNYYADNTRIISTNMYKACSNPIVISDSPILLRPFVMELISAVADESGLDVYQNDTHIVFESTKGKLVGVKCDSESLPEFPAKPLANLLDTALASSVSMNRTTLVQAVDRMCLYVDSFENNRVTLTFKADEVELKSPKTNSIETVKYITAITPVTSEVTFNVDAQFLKNELVACDREAITVRFSDEVGLQLVCGDITLMLSLLNEDEV